MNEANRVLTWAELRELPNETEVWIEEHEGAFYNSAVHKKRGCNLMNVTFPLRYYSLNDYSDRYCKDQTYGWRAWLREPTPEESSAVAWEGE